MVSVYVLQGRENGIMEVQKVVEKNSGKFLYDQLYFTSQTSYIYRCIIH